MIGGQVRDDKADESFADSSAESSAESSAAASLNDTLNILGASPVSFLGIKKSERESFRSKFVTEIPEDQR